LNKKNIPLRKKMRSDISDQDSGNICSEICMPGGGKRSVGEDGGPKTLFRNELREKPVLFYTLGDT